MARFEPAAYCSQSNARHRAGQASGPLSWAGWCQVRRYRDGVDVSHRGVHNRAGPGKRFGHWWLCILPPRPRSAAARRWAGALAGIGSAALAGCCRASVLLQMSSAFRQDQREHERSRGEPSGQVQRHPRTPGSAASGSPAPARRRCGRAPPAAGPGSHCAARRDGLGVVLVHTR
jgi:hypothetical protein